MKKEVNYKVNGEEWNKAQDKAFNKLNANRKIDGFRKGKAPRSIFENKFPGEITMEAANQLIDKKYREVIMDKDIRPVVEPKVNIVKLDDKELEVNFVIVTEPEVKLGEYKNLGVKKDTVKVTKDEVQTTVLSIASTGARLLYIPLVYIINYLGNIKLQYALIGMVLIFCPISIYTYFPFFSIFFFSLF